MQPQDGAPGKEDMVSGDDIGHYDRVVSRFWSNVDKQGDGPEDCWLWTGSGDGHGYGSINILLRGRHVSVKAHRVAYLLAGDVIADGLHVCHTCDNRACVRRSHLWLGTNADNTRDTVAKGRNRQGPLPMLRGESNHKARLTAELVRQARRMVRSGLYACEIARQMGVSETTMQQAINGTTWAHIPCAADSAPLRPAPAKGEHHPAAILSIAQVQEVWRRFSTGQSPAAIAIAMGINRGTVRNITSGKNWREIVAP